MSHTDKDPALMPPTLFELLLAYKSGAPDTDEKFRNFLRYTREILDYENEKFVDLYKKFLDLIVKNVDESEIDETTMKDIVDEDFSEDMDKFVGDPITSLLKNRILQRHVSDCDITDIGDNLYAIDFEEWSDYKHYIAKLIKTDDGDKILFKTLASSKCSFSCCRNASNTAYITIYDDVKKLHPILRKHFKCYDLSDEQIEELISKKKMKLKDARIQIDEEKDVIPEKYYAHTLVDM